MLIKLESTNRNRKHEITVVFTDKYIIFANSRTGKEVARIHAQTMDADDAPTDNFWINFDPAPGHGSLDKNIADVIS